MKYVLVFCSILMTSYMHGQSPLSLDYLSVEEIDKKEITLESEFIDTIEFELSLDNFSSSTYTRTKVLIYKRTKDDFSPKLHVWYHLDPLSNKLLAITYNWDFYNPSFNPDENLELLLEANKKEAAYLGKYQEVNRFLREEFGSDGKVNSLQDSDYAFNEMQYWESKSLYAYTQIKFQRTLDKNPFVGLAANHFSVEMVVSYR